MPNTCTVFILFIIQENNGHQTHVCVMANCKLGTQYTPKLKSTVFSTYFMYVCVCVCEHAYNENNCLSF